MKKSILRRLKWSMMGFGLFMGIIFPVYANFFVIWKEGLLLWFIVGAVAAGCIVGLANHLMVRFILVKNLGQISEVTAAMSWGDTTRILHLESADAIGGITRALNDGLRAVNQSVVGIKRLAKELSQMVHGTDPADQGGMRWAMQKVLAQEEELSELTPKVRELGQQGCLSAERIREEMRTTDQAMVQVYDIVEGLNEKSASIGNIISLLQGISFKIHLISINASVEAARAGEHGLGFGVVADEIRNLAGESASSAHTVAELVAGIEREISVINGLITTLKKAVTVSVSAADESFELFKQVNDMISQTDQGVQHALQLVRTVNTACDRLVFMAEQMKQSTDFFQ